MENIKTRDLVVSSILKREIQLDDVRAAELLAIQLRKTLECIAFGSLISNRSEYNKIHSDIIGVWKASAILKKIACANPNFYPRPVNVQPQGCDSSGRRSFQLEYVKEGFLDKYEFEKMYEACCQILHERNPHRPSINYADFLKAVPDWRAQTTNLLRIHIVHLISGGFYLIEMTGDDRKVHHYTLAPLTADDPEG